VTKTIEIIGLKVKEGERERERQGDERRR